MVPERWRAVDEYLDAVLRPEDAALNAALAAGAAAGLPAHDVAPNQGALLALLARIAGARRVLEIGTLGGYSAIWLARAAQAVVTIEVDADYAAIARANLDRAGVGERVEVLVGPALDVLAELDGPFDLVFIDADKQHHDEYLRWALRLARTGTVIVADNVVRDGAIADPASDDPRVQGVRRFFELVAAEPRLEATAVQTVGVKGWDGFALLRVGD
jgi:predicted O-methyltransferase YrrM